MQSNLDIITGVYTTQGQRERDRQSAEEQARQRALDNALTVAVPGEPASVTIERAQYFAAYVAQTAPPPPPGYVLDR